MLTAADRFWAKVDKREPDECWLWKAAKRGKGYGAMGWGRKAGRWCVVDAHRISWELHFGAIPDGMHVCHTCDVPSCVNPRHLFLGTNEDNVIDMLAKKRQAFGEGNAAAKLSALDVRLIRVAYAVLPVTQKAIGNAWGISQTCVSAIVRGVNWPSEERKADGSSRRRRAMREQG